VYLFFEDGYAFAHLFFYIFYIGGWSKLTYCQILHRQNFLPYHSYRDILNICRDNGGLDKEWNNYH
jgi:hypothetical protein